MRFEEFLNRFEEGDWLKTVEKLLPEIHQVDRNATQVWFRFFPLKFFRYLQDNQDTWDEVIRKFQIRGNFQLKNQIDSSHKFLYGHRFWKEVKEALIEKSEAFDDEQDLQSLALSVADLVAKKTGVDRSLTLGISLVGLMTIVQAGFENFKNSEGKVFLNGEWAKKSPDQIIKERAKDDSQGIFGFLRTIDKQYSVIFDESSRTGRFKAYLNEEITSAAARCNVKTDERCLEGPIPVECKSAACGSCWIGILGGQEKLSEVQRLERKRMKFFGYNQPDESKPFLRLACQAKVQGNVTIVIPPWNGVFGKDIYGIEEEVLEGATTSARRNREIIREVVKNKLT